MLLSNNFKGRTRARPCSANSQNKSPVTPEDIQKTLDELKNRQQSTLTRPSSSEVNVLKLDDYSESDSGIISATTSISDLSLKEDENPVKKVLVRSTRKKE